MILSQIEANWPLVYGCGCRIVGGLPARMMILNLNRSTEMMQFFRGFLPKINRLATFFLVLLATQVHAATYYIDSRNGHDGNSGRTPDAAWKSLRNVSAQVRGVGDDLRLHAGSVFEDQRLVIRWSGAASNWATVDCYRRGSSGQALDCRPADRKPEINGTYEPHCAPNSSCKLFESGAVPDRDWIGLVDADSSFLSIKNIAVRDSASIPIRLLSSPERPRQGFVIEDVDVEHTSARILLVGSNYTDGVIRRVKGNQWGLCYKYRHPACLAKQSPWSGGIVVHDSPEAMILIEDNEVTEGYGEGMICLRSSHVVMRGNKVGDVKAVSYYLDHCSNSIVENNMGWGEIANEWSTFGTAAAVMLQNEDYPASNLRHTVDNIIRNNLFTGHGYCIYAGQEKQSREAGFKIGFQAYGNTCVGMKQANIVINNNVRTPDTIVVQNNLFYSPTSEQQTCFSRVSDRITFRSNFWDDGRKADTCVGPGDQVGNPRLRHASISRYQQFTTQAQPVPLDFAISEHSPAKNGAQSLASRQVFRAVEYGPLVDKLGDQTKCGVDSSALKHDFHCVPRQDPPSFGAIDRSSYPPKPPVLVGGASGGE